MSKTVTVLADASDSRGTVALARTGSWSGRLGRCRRPGPFHPFVVRGSQGSGSPPDGIAVAVRWYLRYGLSHRDVEELLAERGVVVDRVSVALICCSRLDELHRAYRG